VINSIRVGMNTAFIEMGQHKLRSSLSILGVLLGVAALVAMLSLIGGIEVFLNDKMGRWAGAMWIWEEHHPSDEELMRWSRSPGLRLSDGDHLLADSQRVSQNLAIIERRESVSIAGKHFRRMRLYGTSKDKFLSDSSQITIKEGRYLSDEEYQEGSKVCLISWRVYDELVQHLKRNGRDTTKILDLKVSTKSMQLDIVGVIFPADESFQPWHLRWAIVTPLTTVQKYVTGADPNPGHLNIVLSDAQKYEEYSEALVRRLTARHRGVEDFEYRGAEWAEELKKMMQNISMVMGIISVVSLLVGGLGIMNVMLSSISERIKEIGIRKALGAQNLQIFIQFLAETTTLSFTGGAIGACLGLLPIVFSDAIKRSSNGAIAPTVLPEHVAFVFAVIVAVGVLFGLYPAVKASRMSPIDALRYE
jgi:putative ABC transport system permease protein